VDATRATQRVKVTVGDRQVASLAGLHLLGSLADRLGLPAGYSAAVPPAGERAWAHDRGRLLAQVAVMLAGGGRCVADMAALRDQPGLFGRVASAPTIWRALDGIDDGVLDGLRAARAAARARAWAAGAAPAGQVVLDVDASLVEVHSENKEHAASHFKGGYGFHPMFCFADDGQALAGMLRRGNAAANSGADQLAVVDMAIAQLPEPDRRGHRPGEHAELVERPVLVRADSAGAVRAFIDGLVARNCEFSVSARVSDTLDRAIMALRHGDWQPAHGVDPAARRRGAQVDLTLAGWPAGTRAIVRRERPHPGAQLRLWDHNGWRHQVILTNTTSGDPAVLEARHRRHAQVENRIRNLKACGLTRMPFTSFAANQAWMEMTLAAADLLAWLGALCLNRELARAEPRTLRYRILHVAARLTRTARTTWLRLPAHWPWTGEIHTAYRRLALLGT
jgi:Transposase DDE domain group 1